MTNVVDLTRALVALDTVGHAENDALAVLAPFLEEAGFTLEVVEHEPGRGTLIAEWRTGLEVPPLCLSGHLDTVPLGAAPWSHDPFHAEPDGDRLHGRGTSDMKGGIAAIVLAATRLTGTAPGRTGAGNGQGAIGGAARRPPRAGLRLVLTAAEETGSAGALAVADRLRGRPSGPLVIAEPTGNAVALGHKGALWLTARTTGVTAHGSMPHLGDNAVTKLATAVTRLAGYSFPGEPHPVMGAPTLNVATFHGGLNTNSVPDLAEATIDVRTVAGQEHPAVLADLKTVAGPAVALTPLVDLPPVWTEPDHEWAHSVVSAVREITGEKPAIPPTMTYFTDASVLTPALGSVPTVICGPGRPELAHATDEWCSISGLEESVAILERLCRDWCGV